MPRNTLASAVGAIWARTNRLLRVDRQDLSRLDKRVGEHSVAVAC